MPILYHGHKKFLGVLINGILLPRQGNYYAYLQSTVHILYKQNHCLNVEERVPNLCVQEA